MTLDDLLTKGYFPEELLPPFTTEDLTIVRDAILLSLNTFDPITGRKKRITKMTTFSIPKIKGYHRTLSIPNPLHFVRLANTIVTHWPQIELHCNASTISLSPLSSRPGISRAILKPSFKNTTREKIIRSTGNRFLLKIDIAKFYSSIYTHSIPWALHTKSVSKGSRSRTALFGNAIDEDCRKMQDGQTIGLPIGPDTSRIISEIILSAIDAEIKAGLGYLKGVRVVDDYHLYFRSHGDLEKGRAVVNRALKAFELELNQSKEKLLDLPEVIENEWFSEISEFKFRNRWDYQRKDLIAYFDTVVTYSRRFPEEIVLTYAMSKLRFTVFHIKNWKILQSLLMNALLIEPKILPYVAQNLISYHEKGYGIDVAVIQDSLEQFILYHLSLLDDFEVAWALWLAKSLSLTIPERIAESISSYNNPIVVLIALDLESEGLIPVGLVKTGWEALLTTDNLYSEYWLIAYEAFRHGWLTTGVDHVSVDPFFKLLLDNNIAFYKKERKLDTSKVKVTTSPDYFEPYDEHEEQEESDSVFDSIGSAPIQVQPDVDALPDDDDLPF